MTAFAQNQFNLEPIGDDDLPFRWEVYAATIKPYLDDLLGWSLDAHQQFVRTQLKAGLHQAIIVDGERVGVLLVETTAEAISLSQIEILPAYQGRGIGTAVVRWLQDRARAEEVPLDLHVFLTNIGARCLYERMGFEEIERTERDIALRYLPVGGPQSPTPAYPR